MSFSFTVKEEILQTITSADKKRACLYGMLSFCKQFSKEKIIFQTGNQSVADAFKNLVCSLTGENYSPVVSIIKKTNSLNTYTVSVKNADCINALHEIFNINHNWQEKIIDLTIIKKKYISYFVAGAFLACGSVNDPLKEYHLEFVISSRENCNTLCEVLLETGIITKQTERKNNCILYIKESENIEDILTFMGAPKSSLEIMNVKILKDVRNKINRAVNCDSANIEKTLKAAERQIEDIELIESRIGVRNLPEELRDIAILRLENPDWNLKELAQNINPPISRSGANHRLARIKKIAEELRALS